MESKQSEKDVIFSIINNIPSFYHSSDLRNYFSQFIETDGFSCFHFKHRPEVQKQTSDVSETLQNVAALPAANEAKNPKINSTKTFCCIVKVRQNRYKELRMRYNKKHWLDRKGNSIPSLCFISEVRVQDHTTDLLQSKYRTRGELKKVPEDREMFTSADLEKMPELNPPANVMPCGNVGTPTKIFLDLIKQCKLPPKVIGKLGLTFPKSRSKRRYGNVPYEYSSAKRTLGTDETDSSNNLEPTQELSENIETVSGSGHVLESETDYKSQEKIRNKKEDEEDTRQSESDNQSDQESVQDADDCEEWERHEALHDDPANVERNKERLFEEKIELKWEKGGSGLVFYTDAQYWKAQEGGFDEETADDWDVDMSIYYEPNGGDKDARDLLAMRQEKRQRDGIEATDLKTIGFWKDPSKVGCFEKHTKGIGRRVMQRKGWQDGKGLGSSSSGIPQALDSEGQHPKDRSGLGYYGEKLQRDGPSGSKKAKKDYIISTVYDNTTETDPEEPLLRRLEPYHLKHRDLTVPYQAFHKPADPDLQTLK